MQPGSDVGDRFKPRVPGRGIVQVEPADLGEAVGIGKVGFRLGSGERLTGEDRAAIGLPALIDRV